MSSPIEIACCMGAITSSPGCHLNRVRLKISHGNWMLTLKKFKTS